MPSTSPGNPPSSPTPFVQILPGAPTSGLQSVACFAFRQKRYVAYISGHQLNILSGPNVLVQCLTFEEDLVAITAETRSGKLVVAGKSDVWALEPVAEGWTKVRWTKALFLRRDDEGDETRWLSCGIESEVLVAGNRKLSLFSTLPSSRNSAAPSPDTGESVEERRTLWSKAAASPVQYAIFSPSASLIATCGSLDRLVKIWRRLSFEQGLFDYAYLPHPAAVTHLQWRPFEQHFHDWDGNHVQARQDDDPEALYTIATDGVLRCWRTAALHDVDILVLHTTVDLVTAIPLSPSLTIKGGPSSPPLTKPARYVCIVPSDEFCAAAKSAIGLQTAEKSTHSTEHLKEVSSKEPDIVISFDGNGRMSAWGLQSIGHKRRPETPTGSVKSAYHITHAEGLPVRLQTEVNARFEGWFESGAFNLVGHSHNGELRWWRGGMESFFSPSTAGSKRLSEIAHWSGHTNGPIDALKSSSTGGMLLSSSTNGEIVQWKPTQAEGMQNTATYTSPNEVLDFVSILGNDKIDLYSANLEAHPDGVALILRDMSGREIDQFSRVLERIDDRSSCRLFASPVVDDTKAMIVGLNGAGTGFASVVNTMARKLGKPTEFLLQTPDSNDPLQHTAVVFDTSEPDKFGIVCISRSGLLSLYHLPSLGGDLIMVANFDSGVENAGTLTASNDFAFIASANCTELTIVNLTDGYVEYRHHVGIIRHVAAASKDNVVAIAYDDSIDVIAQGRYHHQDEHLPWIWIKQIGITGIGLTIDSLAWLSTGGLVVAAGNSVFLSDSHVPIEELHADVKEAIDAPTASQESVRLSALVRRLNKPVPIWHPGFVAHIVRHGEWSLAASLVGRLLQKLKFWTEGDALSPLLDVPAAQLYGAQIIQDEKTLDRETVDELTQQLEEKDLPDVSQSEQRRLKTVLQAMIFCSEHVKGLDNDALRYLFYWKLDMLRMETNIPEMHWREVAFAFRSTTQQPLLDILMAHYDNKLTWDIAKRLGIFAWLADGEALDRIFDSLAQSAYRSTSPPDPVNASLYFLALHKKQTLLALWRMATWSKEQRATMNFLRRDFTQPEHKTAAKKNAYALMGKRRFEYAAAFFLLADDGASATSVLASQHGDTMLAIAVGRLYSGDASPALRRIVQDRLIPEAKQRGDRWLLSWCCSILQEKESAAYALVQPLEGIRKWHQDDPSALALYRHLRQNASEYEYEAVLRAARIFRRMGLWLVALELVSQWQFRPESKLANGIEFAPAPALTEPATLTDGVASLPAQDERTEREAKAAEMLKKIKAKKDEHTKSTIINEKKPEPTKFTEPDSNSLLDSFGF